jgi:hypothetical protein
MRPSCTGFYGAGNLEQLAHGSFRIGVGRTSKLRISLKQFRQSADPHRDPARLFLSKVEGALLGIE